MTTYARQAHGVRRPPSPSELQTFSARNLQLLQTIESTTTRLSMDCELLSAVAHSMRTAELMLEDVEIKVTLDPEGRLKEVFERISALAQAAYNRAFESRELARNDDRLTEADGVVDGYEAYLAVVSEVFEANRELADRVDMLDAMHSLRSDKAYSNIDDMFSDLGL